MNLKEMSLRDALRLALKEEMQRDEHVILMGEDIGIYGGSFHVTTGLIEDFGSDRVLDTPISESVIVGCAAGAAASGLRPVCEIMFADFISMGFDSLVNQAAKMRYMSGGQVSVPMVVRLPAGSGTGAAAQHSQSVENWLYGIPGLKIVAPSNPAQAKGLLKAAIRDDNPVCFIEGKKLYDMKGMVPVDENYIIPLGRGFIEHPGTDITVVSWGVCLQDVLDLAYALEEEENISVEVVNPLTLYPMDMDTIIGSVCKTGRLLIVHEGIKTGGIGGEIAATVMESVGFDALLAPIMRLGGLDTVVPHHPVLEKTLIPQREDIEDAIYGLLGY